MTGILDWLIGPQDRTQAWLLANQQQPAGLVPPDDAGMEDFWTPDAPQQRAQVHPQSVGDQQPQGPHSPANVPPENTTPPSGPWASWLSDPANQSFMLNMGLQLMSGGYGNWGEALANAISAGAKGAYETERAQLGQQPSEEAPARRSRGGGGRRRVAAGPGAATYAGVTSPQRQQIAAVSEFLNSQPTPEQWAEQNQEGGLIHAVFGGPQDYNNRQQLFTQVQDIQRQLPQAGRRDQGQRITPEQMIEYGRSSNPADRFLFQSEARRLMRVSPGRGMQWGLDEQGNIVAVPIPTSTPAGGRPGSVGPIGNSQIAKNTIASMQAGLTSLRDAREALSETNWAQRFIQNATGMGRMADLMPQLNRLARLPMHGVSGAQVNIPETQSYLNSFMPNPADPRETWERLNFKLNNLEWLLANMLQAAGGSGLTDQQALELRNSMRERLGSRPLTMEEHMADQTGQRRPPLPSAPGTIPVEPRTPAQPLTPPAPQPNEEEMRRLYERYGLTPRQ